MNYTEQSVKFTCGGDSLIGILAAPQEPRDTAVLVIVGGPQYRAGSHRQFVLLARKLAASGFPVLRFDSRGMGDSTGTPRGFESLSTDIGAAIDALQTHVPQVQHVALWGLCDGASAALLYCHETHDARIIGLCLLNPWVRSDASLARTHVKHYYARRLRQREFWQKMFHGGIGVRALAGMARNIRMALIGSRTSGEQQEPFQQRMATAWNEFQHSIVLLLSGDDYTAKEFLEHVNAEAVWTSALKHPLLQRHEVGGADHTFSKVSDRIRAEELTLQWLDTLQTR